MIALARTCKNRGVKELSSEQIARYSRHLTLPQVGVEGQQRLLNASVLIVGVGGLGCPAALYLAAAGVGRIGLVDFDRVDASNLQRQVLFTRDDLGEQKVDAAARRLRQLNPDVTIERHAVRLDADNGISLLDSYDLVLDGSDNFTTRYLVNDAAVLTRTPNVFGSIFRFEGQLSIFGVAEQPCYRCLFPTPPPNDEIPNCAEGGVLGVLPGTVGTLQATEALKWILGIGTPLVGRLRLYDALGMQSRELNIPRDPGCAVCGDQPTIDRLRIDETVGRLREPAPTITPTSLDQQLRGKEPPRLLDVRSDNERAIVALPNAIGIPLDRLEERADELGKESYWVVYCKSGARSERAVQWLRDHGFTRVEHLEGGIDRWATEIDPSLPRY